VKKILLKLSGESLSGGGKGFSEGHIKSITDEIKAIWEMGIEIGIVVGGGNIVRGKEFSGGLEIGRINADYMGMLGTLINGIVLNNMFEKVGIPSILVSPYGFGPVAEEFSEKKVNAYLRDRKIIIFGFGTGNPLFTTDTAAALRSFQIGADALIKGTKVDGIYNKDPLKHPDAKFYNELTYMDVLRFELKVIDATAISLCKEFRIPIYVLNITKEGNLRKLISGEKIGTTIR